MSTKLYTTQQAAELIGFTDSRLRQLIAVGIARPKQRIGHSWVFTVKEIERLCNRRHAGKKAVSIGQWE
jgi:hypothetical protein